MLLRFLRVAKTGNLIRRSVSYPPGSDILGSGSGAALMVRRRWAQYTTLG